MTTEERWWLAAVLPFWALALFVHGAWAVAGIAGGVGGAAWLVIHRAPARAAAVAASLPPLVAVGPAILAPAAVLVLLAASARTRSPWLMMGTAVLALAPFPSGSLGPALGGGMVLAAAPWPLALMGVPLAAVGWVAAPAAFPYVAGAVLLSGAVARLVARHPANLTMAGRLVTVSIAVMPVPALVATIGLSIQSSTVEPIIATLTLALLTGMVGVTLGLGFLGAATLVRGPWPSSAVSVAAMLGFVGALAGLGAQAGATVAAATSLPLLALASVPAAVGFEWILRFVGKGRFARIPTAESIARPP